MERLLACGHSVRVLCRPRGRPPPAGDVLDYLKVGPNQHETKTEPIKLPTNRSITCVLTLPQVLPGAEQHLTVVSGDVTDAAALQAAMAQCQQLVHLAGVVDVLPPRDEQQRQQMVSTALEGTRLVLGESTNPSQLTLTSRQALRTVPTRSVVCADVHPLPDL